MCFKYTVVVIGSCIMRFRTRKSKYRGRWSPPHLGDILHVAVRTGEAVVAMAPVESECEVWRCFGHATEKHGRFSHSRCDVSWPCAVTERCRVRCWSGGGTDRGDGSGGILSWRRDFVWTYLQIIKSIIISVNIQLDQFQMVKPELKSSLLKKKCLFYEVRFIIINIHTY